MRLSAETDKLLPALAKAQNAKVKKNKEGHKYTYADLKTVFEAIQDGLDENQLSVIQTLDDQAVQENQVCVITRIYHESGQWIESRLIVTSKNPDPQGLGSAITYGRRYSLLTMLGLTPEDDDGQQAKAPAPAPLRAAQPINKKAPLPVPPQVAAIEGLMKQHSISKEEAMHITQLKTLKGINEAQAIEALNKLDWHIKEMKGAKHA